MCAFFARFSFLQNQTPYRATLTEIAALRLLLDKIKTFEANLHERIHLENNIMFPDAIAVEAASVA